jgi:hypothetical protein
MAQPSPAIITPMPRSNPAKRCNLRLPRRSTNPHPQICNNSPEIMTVPISTRKMATWTICPPGPLFAVTVCLLIVAGVQARIYRNQAKIMRSQLFIATTAARASRRSADAALSQVRLIIAMESPVFSWIGFKLEQQSGVALSGISGDTDYRPVVIIKNVGRSPLELRAFCIDTIRGEFHTNFGTGPKYTNVIPLEFIAEQGREVPLYSPQTIRFSEEEARAFSSGERLFYIYGFVRYYNQFTDEVWEAGRIGMWRPSTGFVPTGPPGYAYHRRQEPTGGNTGAQT